MPNPDRLLGIALRYQIAQKLHACSDPHDPPTERNDRPRDVVDLLLLRQLLDTDSTAPTLLDIEQACTTLFEARAADARALGREARSWPPTVVAHPHWPGDYAHASAAAGTTLALEQAVDSINEWVADICAAATQ